MSRGVLTNVSAHARTLNPLPPKLPSSSSSTSSSSSKSSSSLSPSPIFVSSHFPSSVNLITAHANFHNPRTTPSGRKVIRRRRKREERKRKEEKKKQELSGHFVFHAAHLQRRTFSARTSLRPKVLREVIGKILNKH
jgi:hypothetical protein